MTQEELEIIKKEIQEQKEIIKKATNKIIELQKKLKAPKETKQLEEKYAPINFKRENIINTEAKPLIEYEIEENTEEFIQKFEEFIKNILKTLREQRIPCNQIKFSSDLGVLGNENFVNMLKERIIEIDNNPNYNEYGKFYSEIIDGIENQTSKTHIPLDLHICPKETGTEYVSITEFNDEKTNNIAKTTISGIVNLEAFLYTMKFLGYNIQISNNGRCKNMDDYKKVFKENGLNNTITINVDKEKIKTFQEESKDKAR